MEIDSMPSELHLAAIIALLSSSALRGTTAAKAAALRAHLEAAAFSRDAIAPPLRNALENALAEWLTTDCHEQSIAVDSCALLAPSQTLH